MKRDDICPTRIKRFTIPYLKNLLDIGDYVGVKGYVFITQTGEISVHVQELTILGEIVKPLPVVKT
jgi:lysyl-tRNA synthetase class 2